VRQDPRPLSDGEAELGYRVGRDFAGRGLGTGAVRQVCRLAATTYGLKRLRAGTYVDNHGSRNVLLRNGFTLAGETGRSATPAWSSYWA